MDCFYIVDWQEWFHCIDEGCLCEGAKAQAAEEDNSEDDIEQVDALDARANAPVASKRKTSGGTPRPPKEKTNTKHPQATRCHFCHVCFGRKSQAGAATSKEGQEMNSLGPF